MRNIYDNIEIASKEEVITPLLQHKNVTIERIVSSGQVTPEDKPYQQQHDEWVIVLQGEAILKLENRQITLNAGDSLLIPQNIRHWVTYTSTEPKVIWLVVHIDHDKTKTA